MYTKTLEAFKKARGRASVAAAIHERLMHMAVLEARAAGLSVREAAAALEVPKTTVGRHWKPDHVCIPATPTWGTESDWRDTDAAIWSHDPGHDDWIPYLWAMEADGTVRAQPRWRGHEYVDPTTGATKLAIWPNEIRPEELPEGARVVSGHGPMAYDSKTGLTKVHMDE